MTEEITHKTAFQPGLTPGEVAVLMYLHMRRMENAGPATRDSIIADTHLSERTVDGALAKLKKLGRIQRIIAFEAAEDLKYTD